MKSIRLARLLLVGLVILLTLMPVGGAWATPPEHSTYQLEWEAMEWVDCGDFWVLEDAVVDVRATNFYDQDGNWIRTQEHWTLNGFVYNSEDPTHWLPENPTHLTITYDEAGGQVYVGRLITIQVPGQGIIWEAAGRQVWDSDWNLTFWAGPNDWLEGDTDALCAALE